MRVQMSQPGDITTLLAAARAGDADSQGKLFEVVYRQLRTMAAGQMRNERPGHTLQPSALVNEAYLRLLGRTDVSWENRAHFFSTAAGTMRRILIDHARARRAQKRDGALQKVDLDAVPALFADEDAERLLAVDDALQTLAEWDARQATVVNLKFFAGLSTEEIAAALNISERTVKRDWRMARAWLLTRLGDASSVP
jgi:RNA polymerase sigma factor (TIGR02999 family)